MARILLTWELGGGMGHLLPLRALGLELAKRGHRVMGAFNELKRARELFHDTSIELFPAPVHAHRGPRPVERTFGFAHVLANSGFADEANLRDRFTAWNTLFKTVQPDLVVADHSPTALLSLWGLRIARLSRRERQILHEVVVGHSTKIIAEGLHIAVRTVDHHRGSVMERMQALNVADLVRIAIGADYDSVPMPGFAEIPAC